MGDHIDFRPQARVDGLVSETVDDGLVVYDTTNCVAHALAAEAASVWGRCDGTRSPAEIARELGMEGDRVDSAISELGRCGLLEAPSQAPPRFSRREAGAKLGKAAVLGPLIVSLAIPTPAAAASPTTCPAGARPGARCLQNGPAMSPSGNPVNRGGFGYSTSCPIVGGNGFNQNCYVAGGGAVICTGTGCVPLNQGCNSTTAKCCAGVACCTVPEGGGFEYSQ